MFERAWTLRGMENLLADMILNPQFVDDLLDNILEYNLASHRPPAAVRSGLRALWRRLGPADAA